MNRGARALLGLLVVSPVLQAAPAAAAVHKLVITGRIQTHNPADAIFYDQFDRLGLFAAAGTNLAGMAFSSTYTIDTSQPWLIDGSVYSSGVNAYWDRGSAITASVTINGVTVSGIGQAINGSDRYNGFGSQQQMSAGNGSANGGYDILNVSTGSAVNYPGLIYSVNGKAVEGLSLRTNVAIGQPGREFIGSNLFPTPFDFAMDPYTGNGQFNLGGWRNGQNVSFNAYFAMERATWSLDAAAGAVPEPATWAMLILGFGAVGAGLRTRRRARTALAGA
jgi:hypothetical protein